MGDPPVAQELIAAWQTGQVLERNMGWGGRSGSFALQRLQASVLQSVCFFFQECSFFLSLVFLLVIPAPFHGSLPWLLAAPDGLLRHCIISNC